MFVALLPVTFCTVLPDISAPVCLTTRIPPIPVPAVELPTALLLITRPVLSEAVDVPSTYIPYCALVIRLFWYVLEALSTSE